MRLTYKHKFFYPETNFTPGWDFISVTFKHTLRVRLHVTEMKSHPGMIKFLFTREFHPMMKRVEFHPGMKFNLKENFPLSMKTYKNLSFYLNMLKHQTIIFLEKQLCSSFSFAYFLIMKYRKIEIIVPT